MKKVIVAMSGGVDSSVAAYKMLENGFNVIGVTLTMGRKCDQDAVNDAKKVSEKLGIKHFALDASNDFDKNVLNYFESSYLSGETPNPCAMCNKFVKFKKIIEFMKENNANFIATGHYAKIVENNSIFELHKGDDIKKDQSYFLTMLDYDFLQYIKFPLHDILDKSETREIARKIGLHVADKKDSQDICFISDNNYKRYLFEERNIKPKDGLIKHVNGEVLGRHNGIINYTIGQRKGIGVSYGKPIYVVKIDGKNNIVYVGDEKELYSNTLTIKNVNILNDIIHDKDLHFGFKLRSTHNEESGKIELLDDNRAKITLDEETRAITKGQLCSVYYGDMIIGGGWIE